MNRAGPELTAVYLAPGATLRGSLVKTVRLSLVNSSARQYLLSPSYQAVVTLSPTAGRKGP
jgi:hypothetical protein